MDILLQRNGVAMVAGEDAGPRDGRYVANLVASLLALLLALSAATATELLGLLPMSLVATLAGLTLIGALKDALKKTVQTDLPVGAFFALAIGASPMTVLGTGPAFLGLVGGLLVSFLLERGALAQAWYGR